METDAGAEAATPRRRWIRRLTLDGRTLRHAGFEVLIVALGVLLALAVDEARQAAHRRELLAQTRAALRSELLANRERLIDKLEALAELYPLAAADTDQLARKVAERRNRALVPSDAAWNMAVQAGTIRWMDPDERLAIAQAYSSQGWSHALVTDEMASWTELAAFQAGAGPEEMRRRAAAIAVWRAWATRAYTTICVLSARYERALGAPMPDHAGVVDACSARPVAEHPRALYAEWARRGWLSDAGSPFRR